MGRTNTSVYFYELKLTSGAAAAQRLHSCRCLQTEMFGGAYNCPVASYWLLLFLPACCFIQEGQRKITDMYSRGTEREIRSKNAKK